MQAPPVDPRPRVVESQSGQWQIVGWRCVDCGHPQATVSPRCVACGGDHVADRFGPTGTVWSATVVRVPAGDRQPPYGLAYVDLDGGPRILTHTGGDGRLSVGAVVALVAPTDDGDPRVEVSA